MGQYAITILGVGRHSSPEGTPGKENDAEALAAKLVGELMAAGHSIEKASITIGPREDLMPIGKRPLSV